MLVLKAGAAGAAVWTILQTDAGEPGAVLAVYRRSLLWLAAPDQPLTLSFCPELRGPLTLEVVGPVRDGGEMVLPGTAVTRDGDFLCFGPRLAVDLRGVHLWDPPLPDLTAAQAETVLKYTELRPAGLERSQFQALCHALAAGESAAVETEVKKLVGLGPGLTPSGDDFLAGALAALQATAARESALLADAIAPLLDRTTPLSRQFLRCALRGQYADRVLELLAHPGPDTLQRLLQVGATSGADTLLGIWAGLHLALGRALPPSG